jgi:hydroxymethylpyrimidine kinase/phosphomethylpyrimidine kinase
VLSVAGSDPTGGAGIQADLKTFEALGADGCAVPVALTVQNSRGVARVDVVPPDLVAQQIDAVLSDIDVRAVKIGMLANASIVRVVADAIRRYHPPFVVLDPVIRSTSGATLLSDDGVDVLRTDLLPLVTLVTPNAAEAGILAGARPPTSVSEAHTAAKNIRSSGARNVLVTGGHVAAGGQVVDVLGGEDGDAEFSIERIPIARTHGTGCRLSSAIAAHVALGTPLVEACGAAQRFVRDWLASQVGSLVEAR